MNKQEQYLNFLQTKIKLADKKGFSIDPAGLHASSLPHQVKIIPWACERGAALIAADCGMGKTHIAIETCRMIHQTFGGKCLIVTELGAADTFTNQDPEYGEGKRLGVNIEYVTNQREAIESSCWLVLTNYERVRNGNFDFSAFACVWLDEGNYIKNMASETTNALQVQLARVRFKYIASATPNPNRTLELVNYAHVLNICDRGQILTRFFQRNSTSAGDLTLHPQHEEDFWLWVYSWMVSIERPSDMGLSDDGYQLPPLSIEWNHEVKMDKALEAGATDDGQHQLYIETSGDNSDRARIRRESIDVRIRKTIELIKAHPNKKFIIWHKLESERYALEKALNDDDDIHQSIESVYGTQNWTEREQIVTSFMRGEVDILITKPELCGVGLNFQRHCHLNIFMSPNYDWDELYQAIKRTHRFGQKEAVTAYIVWVSEQHDIISVLKGKQQLHNEQREKLRSIAKKFEFDQNKFIEEKKRHFHTSSKRYKGDCWELVESDCVLEWMERPDNSIQLINTSFPFGNHYEYTDKYNDFGHNQDLNQFADQLAFLIPELLRTLEPGRICAVHLKNRIHYGSVTGKGFSIFHRFTHRMCDEMERHGFETMGFHYIPTDVVAENNQTYRLTYGEMRKDSTKMGAGIPEEIWLFRKPPSSNANAYADTPVTHSEEDYPLSKWQIDADAFWGSSGNRLLTGSELKKFGLDKIQSWWKKFKPETVYNFEEHINLLEELDAVGKLSRTFTTLPMQSNTDYIWNDVNRMHGLNLEQSRRKEQNHICPQPFDEAERIIELYSNPGDVIADPFNGLGTTGVSAIKKGRRYFGTELNATYCKHAAFYLKAAEYKKNVPTLFDVISA